MNAHFFLDAGADDIIGLTQAAVVIHPDLGDQKKGDTLGAGRRVFNTGQHRVNDVFRQIMFPGGNKDFVAAYRVGAIVVFDRRGGQRAHIGTGFGFGQQHRAGPFPGKHLFQVEFFLLWRAECLNQPAGSVGQSGIHHKGKIASDKKVVDSQRYAHRHTLTAPFRIIGKGHPFALFKQLPGLVKGLRNRHPSVIKASAFAITFDIDR